MKEQLMKIIDQQVHSPTMTFADFRNAIESVMEKNGFRTHAPVSHILVNQLNGIGDGILISGFLRELRKGYPKATISLVCHDAMRPVFEHCPYIDNLFPLKQAIVDNVLSRIITCIDFFDQNKIWDMHPNLAFSTHCTEMVEEAILLSWLSGAERRVGYGQDSWKRYFEDPSKTNFVGHENDTTFDSLLTDDVQYPLDIVHDVERRYYMLEYLDKPVTEKRLELWTAEADRKRAQSILDGYEGKKIVLGIGGSMGNKQYPLKLYQKAIKEIKKAEPVTFFAVGGSDCAIDTKLDAIDLCGRLSIGESQALIEQADMYIGNDTGTVHMAAAADKPIIMLCREAKDRTPIYTGFMSAYTRFYPYGDKDKIVVLQPEKAIDECKHAIIHGGCCHYESHCIAKIPYKQIVEAYKQLRGMT